MLATIEWQMISRRLGLAFFAAFSRTYSASKRVPAGKAGKIYPGNFDAENEKNIIGMTNHVTRNTDIASSDLNISLFLFRPSFHQERAFSRSDVLTNIVHGTSPSKTAGR